MDVTNTFCFCCLKILVTCFYIFLQMVKVIDDFKKLILNRRQLINVQSSIAQLEADITIQKNKEELEQLDCLSDNENSME